MKQLTQYQCECCGTIYKSESECESCEKNHIKLASFKRAIYNSHKNGGGYAQSIIMMAEDGATLRYDFAGKQK